MHRPIPWSGVQRFPSAHLLTHISIFLIPDPVVLESLATGGLIIHLLKPSFEVVILPISNYLVDEVMRVAMLHDEISILAFRLRPTEVNCAPNAHIAFLPKVNP